MGANIAGIYGAQIFRQDDRPLYRRGFSINCAVLAVGLTLAIVRFVDDKLRRRRSVGQLQPESASEQNSHDDEKIPAALESKIPPQTTLIGHHLNPVVPTVAK